MSRLALYFLGPPRVYLDGVRRGDRPPQGAGPPRLPGGDGGTPQPRRAGRAAVRRAGPGTLAGQPPPDPLAAGQAPSERNGSAPIATASGFPRRGPVGRRGRVPPPAGQRAHGAKGAAICPPPRPSLAEAVGLYRGEFLSGFFLTAQPGFRGLAARAAGEPAPRAGRARSQRLVEIHAARGQYDQAIEFARRWLALDPLEEGVHRQLMRLHGLAGQPSEALRQYERCRSALERELGEKPEEETEQLREQIAFPQAPAGGRSRGCPGTSGPCCSCSLGRARRKRPEQTRLREAIAAARGSIARHGRTDCCARSLPRRGQAVEAALAAQSGRLPGPMRPFSWRERAACRRRPLRRRSCSAPETAPGGHAPGPGPARAKRRRSSRARRSFPRDATLRSLGAHRLSDLGPAQTLYQLEHPACRRTFPR